MIEHLSIKNFAIITKLEIPFHKGLTVITGETGSGKSILMEALQVGTGGKGKATHVMNGADRSVIEVSTGKDDLRRIVYSSGRTKSYINDEPVAEAEFRKRIQKHVDFHGQHDQQYILDIQSHIQYLDRFAGVQNHSVRIQEIYHALRAAKMKLKQLLTRKKRAEEKQELQRYQLQEIQSANLQPDEDAALEKEAVVLRHFDELMQTTRSANHHLLEADQSIINQLNTVRKSIEKLQRIDEAYIPYLKEIESAIVSLQESSTGMLQYVETLDHDPERLSEIEERLSVLEGLKRKYGGSLDAVIHMGEELQKANRQALNLDDEILSVTTEITGLETEFRKLADLLHQKRETCIPQLAEKMAKEMEQLNMPGVVFEINMKQKEDNTGFVTCGSKPVEANESGYDLVEFYLSVNPGIPPKPLAKVASGGEISRDRKSTRLNSSHTDISRMPSSA